MVKNINETKRVIGLVWKNERTYQSRQNCTSSSEQWMKTKCIRREEMYTYLRRVSQVRKAPLPQQSISQPRCGGKGIGVSRAERQDSIFSLSRLRYWERIGRTAHGFGTVQEELDAKGSASSPDQNTRV